MILDTMPDFGGPSMAEDQRAERLTAAIESERIRREARRFVDAEEQPREPLPPFTTLRDRLAQPAPAALWRIRDLQTRHSRVMSTAQFKTGKTTQRDNLTRSLIDGDPFLGRFDVLPLTGALVILDTEMSEPQMDRWLRDQGIRNDDRVIPIPLRGRAAGFNILIDEIRREWATRLRAAQCEYLILDCLRPVLDAVGLDEQSEAGRFLVAFDALLADAGVTEALVIQHMGHTNERARGDSRLRDWPDAEWRMMRRDDNPASARYFTAYGRDVDIPESQLVYDPATRRLTIEDGSRRDAAGRDALDAVLDVLRATAEPLSGRAIKAALDDSGHARAAVETALRLGVKSEALTKRSGPRNSQLYALSVPVSRTVPLVSRDSSVQCPTALIERDTRTLPEGLASSNGSGHSPVFDPSLAFVHPKGGVQ